MRLPFLVLAAFLASSFAQDPDDPSTVQDQVPYDNEHHELYQLFSSVVHRGSKRDFLEGDFLERDFSLTKRFPKVNPAMVLKIRTAVSRTAHLPHYFWTGTLPPHRQEDSRGERGGITLEDTVDGIGMPPWTQQDQLARDTWTYASTLFARNTTGGNGIGPTNVFDTEELPNLIANPNVPAVYQILLHPDGAEDPVVLWPEQAPTSAASSVLADQVSTSCTIYSRSALWRHQRSESTPNFATRTRWGFFYGGQSSRTNPGAFTYSIAPATTTAQGSQADMASWINSHPTFDAQFSSSTSFQPTTINYGTGWIAYETACPNAYQIDRMGGLKVRGLPAGDSITVGFESSTGNGYRETLEENIKNPPWMNGLASRQSGDVNAVDFIGSQISGTMPRSRQRGSGHSGAEINTIGGFLMPDLSQNPTVIFLLAGTNDINNGDDIDNAPDRLMAVVDAITLALPNAAVLPSGNTFNDAIVQELLLRSALGDRVLPVYMDSLGPEDMTDGLHPNDQGYNTMGLAWFGAFWQAAQFGCDFDKREWERDEFCPNNPVWYPQGEIANGAGLGANGGLFNCMSLEGHDPTCSCQFVDPSQSAQVFPVPPSGQCSDLNDNSTAVRFADLNSDGRAEYLWLDAQGVTTAFLNLGSTQGGMSKWLPSGVIATGVGAARHQVQFADLNGDGRAEYLFVHDDGSVDAWLNLGRDGVRFADLNGDGRAEYLYLEADGAMTVLQAANVNWLPQDVVATGPANGATRDNIILADVNGDGKADYLSACSLLHFLGSTHCYCSSAVTHTGGVVEVWLNGGGPDNGPKCQYLLPPCLAAKVLWHPQGVIATGVGSSGARYLDVDAMTSAVNAWLNGCP
ncbi:hypothetical protein B0H14DRAFT_3041203 [Mycena olivaceomarginata]|nr:hypothetical protein B0H14DRAFT_3041203 [Mycena olivaceomarginata]